MTARQEKDPTAAESGTGTVDRTGYWPAGKRLAVLVNVALEGWSRSRPPGIGPMGNPLPADVVDSQALSWAEYGPRKGMSRLLEVLQRSGTRATIMTSGVIADRYPGLLKEAATAGHEICAHGYWQDQIPSMLGAAEEAESIRRCLDVIESAAGARPRGWISPRCTPSLNTPRLLAEAGLRWHADYFDDDLPRVEETVSGPIVAIPFTMEVNDLPLHVRHGRSAEQFVSTLRALLDGWFACHPEPACMDITVHAHVFGRPLGAAAFEEALAVVDEKQWAWTPTHSELAATCRLPAPLRGCVPNEGGGI